MTFIKKIKNHQKPKIIKLWENHDISSFEKISWHRGMFNFVATSLLAFFPGLITGLLIKKSNQKAKIVHENVATHTALDALYSTGLKFGSKKNIANSTIEHTWFNLNNPKSVRNRLRIVKKILYNDIYNRIDKGQQKILIVSLASGSARAVIETLKKFPKLNYEAIMLDRSSKALEDSQKLIQKNNLDLSRFSLCQDNVRNFPKYSKDRKIDIIEMVGLLDYLNEEKAQLIFKKIYDNLADKGTFITANIRHNQERKFIENALNWKMVYREPIDLERELAQAGFKHANLELYYEPLKIHGVAKAVKK